MHTGLTKNNKRKGDVIIGRISTDTIYENEY